MILQHESCRPYPEPRDLQSLQRLEVVSVIYEFNETKKKLDNIYNNCI